MSPEQASGRQGGRRPDRRLLARRGALRDAGRRAAVHRPHGAGDDRQAADASRRRACGGSGPTCRRAWTRPSSGRWPRCRPTDSRPPAELRPGAAGRRRDATAPDRRDRRRPRRRPRRPQPRTPPAGRHAARRPVPVLAITLLARLPARPRRAVRLAALAYERRTSSPGGGSRVLAVLPFENLGDSTTDYFADGITDAVRGKLSALPGLQVIASGSSNEYKAQRQAAAGDRPGAGGGLPADRPDAVGEGGRREQPGEGQPGAGGRGPGRRAEGEVAAAVRRRRSPTCSRCRPTSRTRWPTALDLALGDGPEADPDRAADGEPRGVRRVPEGRGDPEGSPSRTRPALRKRDQLLRAGGGARLHLRGGLGRSSAERRRATTTTSRRPRPPPRPPGARPSGPSPSPRTGRRRMAGAVRYYYRPSAATTARRSMPAPRDSTLTPDNADLLTAAALAEQGLGRWDAALRSTWSGPKARPALAPRRRGGWPTPCSGCGATPRRSRPRRSRPRRVTRQPRPDREQGHGPPRLRATSTGARRVIADGTAQVEPTALVTFFANYWDLFWVLDDDQQQLLLRLPPGAVRRRPGSLGARPGPDLLPPGRHGAWRASTPTRPGLGSEQTLADTPDDPQRRILLGLALAYLGRKAEAIREGERGLALLPTCRRRLHRPLPPAPARPDLHPRRRAREGARPARAAAADAVLPLAGLAPDRPDVRSAAEATRGSGSWWRAPA